jgi:ATP-dependent Lhr-like helicase
VRRGYFVAGMGGAQFALPGTDELLRRAPRSSQDTDADKVVILAASDPANAYGALLKWPATAVENLQPQRTGGARVFVNDGRLLAYLGRTGNHLITFPADDPADQQHDNDRLGAALASLAHKGAALLIGQIDGRPPSESSLAEVLTRNGFVPTSRGLLRRPRESAEGLAPYARR